MSLSPALAETKLITGEELLAIGIILNTSNMMTFGWTNAPFKGTIQP